MKYFRIKQDKNFKPFPIMNDVFYTLPKNKISINNHYQLNDYYCFYLKSTPNIVYSDVLDFQRFFVSKDIKRVFEAYAPYMVFKHICMIDLQKKEHVVYYLPIFTEINCVSYENSIYNLDKSYFSTLVLQQKKLTYQKIFKIGGIKEEIIIISLDVLESMLRRQIYQFEYSEILTV